MNREPLVSESAVFERTWRSRRFQQYICKSFTGVTRANLLRELRNVPEEWKDDVILRSVEKEGVQYFKDLVAGYLAATAASDCPINPKRPHEGEVSIFSGGLEVWGIPHTSFWTPCSCQCPEVAQIVEYFAFRQVRLTDLGGTCGRFDVSLASLSPVEIAIGIGKYAKLQKQLVAVEPPTVRKGSR